MAKRATRKAGIDALRTTCGSSDASRQLDNLRAGVIDRLRRAWDTYKAPARTLSGNELREATRLFDDFSIVHERWLELRDIEARVDDLLDREPTNAAALALRREKHYFDGLVVCTTATLIPYLKLSADAIGLDPSPFTHCIENPTRETRASAIALAEGLRLRARDSADTKPPTLPAGDDQPSAPALTVNQTRVLQTMARFDPSRLLSSKTIADEMDATSRLSEETVRQCVGKLIGLRLAERPEGDRSGARLTIAGRRLAGKIAD
jgi:hypothetical protein